MSINDNKPTYGTAPAVEEILGTKGSRRNLVVGLVRPNGFDSGMSFPGMPESAASTPGGGYKNEGY